MQISQLQFADDTLIIGEKSLANIRSMSVVLILFEEVLGLKVNFHKSKLTAVNVSDLWLYEATRIMNCIMGTIPFVYLGLPIGGDDRRLSFWKSVVDLIISRMSTWK
jgi:hypothetical protein